MPSRRRQVFADRRLVFSSRRERMVDGAGPIDKERDSFVDSQRRQTKNAFAAYFERLAAGREDA